MRNNADVENTGENGFIALHIASRGVELGFSGLGSLTTHYILQKTRNSASQQQVKAATPALSSRVGQGGVCLKLPAHFSPSRKTVESFFGFPLKFKFWFYFC